GGGSGFENLVQASHAGVLDADIVAVVSNHEHGCVRARAERLGIPFIYFPGPYDAEHYSNILQNIGIEKSELWVALSGWLKHVKGLDSQKTFNIHPALLSHPPAGGCGRFGGKGMYGMHIHEAVKAALDAGEISESGFTMHFVTDEYDRGPAFFEHRVPLHQGMSAEEIAKAVNAAEHEWQPKITNMVVHGQIRWDGKNPKSLVVPKYYEFLPQLAAEVHY
ncbi:MAG: formyltransferase family protein, partial [bacterium]|nr:formyltransferase family protein [bacterium]